MKLRLSILLLAAALAASPAAGQTIKSLGYNTTNGFVTYSGSNSLTFTNALQFSTNARAATRTNLGGTTVGNAVFTATNAAAAATAIGLGTANEVTFGRVAAGNTSLSTNGFSGGDFAVTAGYALTFVSGGVASTTRTNLGLPGTWLTNTDVTNFCTAIGLGATNNVTFSNITASGTLGVTGNVTLSGSDNLMPNATNAASASSLMTRSLSDARFYPLASFWLPAEDMQSYNAAGTGNPEWTNIVGIANMVTPFGRSPRTVAAPDASGSSQGIYTIPTGWPAGAQVRVTTYLALFGGGATTNTFVLQTGGYWTTNTNIISPVATAIGSVFSASSLLTTNVAGTGATNEYFKISNTFSFATNANVANRQVFVGRSSTSTNDTATNTIYFIGSHVELLP